MMYKDSDITAAMIQEKFPSVATEIALSMSGSIEQTIVTADSFRQSHPDLVAMFQKEGVVSANIDIDASIKAENSRVISILALSKVGYEDVINAALADSTMTPEKVKVQLFDAMSATNTATFSAHKKDGESLGADLLELGGSSADGVDTKVSDDKKAVLAMAEAGKQARGETK